MKKLAVTATIIAIMAFSSPASAKWKDSVGKDWDTIEQCLRTKAVPCTWGGKLVDQSVEQAVVIDKSAAAKGGPVRDPLVFTLVKAGDIKLPDAKTYCLAADGAVSNMPLHSSNCGPGKSEIQL